ncbi:MAG: cell surface protein SprA [Flavobacteriales bacterium]|nr:cell surface protein SprA [Flavobacteriales bacterium]
MKIRVKYLFKVVVVLLCIFASKVDSASAQTDPDSGKIVLPFPIEDPLNGDSRKEGNKNLLFKNPPNTESEIKYDPKTGKYVFKAKEGSITNRPASEMTLEEFLKYQDEKSNQAYFEEAIKAESLNSDAGFRPKLNVGGEVFDRIFGGNSVDIKPQGSAELIFNFNVNRNDDPILTTKQRKVATFQFDEKIQLNVIGKIGDKLQLNTNYNTEANFDFENQMKLEYTGYEDDIIKRLEVGNVSLPLSSTLITGSQTLFGIKSELQFGRLTITTVLSQEKGEKSVIEVSGGAQINDFEIKADNYEANKHYFLSQYFRDNYDTAMSAIPVITSAINITKVEVWLTNSRGETQNIRNIVAFQDLAEARPYSSNVNSNGLTITYPRNDVNSLDPLVFAGNYPAVRDINTVNSEMISAGLLLASDYEKLGNARKLKESEYDIHPTLGYISLKQALYPDQVLAVAYQYSQGNTIHTVGEFSSGGNKGPDGPSTLILKLLKSTVINTKLPMWNLQMKNVYSIGSYGINAEGFKLQVVYNNRETGVDINYIPEGAIKNKLLIDVMELDNLNVQNDRQSDGVFDFLDGITIDKSTGRIFFPVIEPFGQQIRDKMNDDKLADDYAFDSLYTTTQGDARVKFPDKNRFKIMGSYKSVSNSDISLNTINVPRESVTVTAGGAKLTEGVDYTVSYEVGRLTIINDKYLNSSVPIKISLESNSLFGIQSKRLMGTNLNYIVSDNFNVGGTILNLSEKPLTPKINIGDEPMSNTIWGMNVDYNKELPLLTKWVDMLPLIETKTASKFTFTGEFAHIIPGHSGALGKEGTSYIDDFEGSQSEINLKPSFAWVLASTPQGQTDLFPEAATNTIDYGKNRAKLAWYTIDPLFHNTNSSTPDNVKKDAEMQSNHYMRAVLETEVFPNKDPLAFTQLNIPVMDLAFYPDERGPYNYDDVADPSLNIAGIKANGELESPADRWGGIMRQISTNDFEAANVEFIQFWMMDPFDDEDGNPDHNGGDLYFNLGNISEDILKDSRISFENGLPVDKDNLDGVDEALWGRVPNTQAIVHAFDAEESSREFQDVGLDGLRDIDEATKYQAYLDNIEGMYGTASQAYKNAAADPSGDNFAYFRGSSVDSKANILERYKDFNGHEGNSSIEEPDGYPIIGTRTPDTEDKNSDNTISENESYFQYRISLTPDVLNDPVLRKENYITSVTEASLTTNDGRSRNVTWYQFRIPIRTPDKVVGNIPDFRSIRFIRMFLKEFDEAVILRFARLELVRSEWRKYGEAIEESGVYVPDESPSTSFDVAAVNIEEHAQKSPVNYVLPPGLLREVDNTTSQLRELNEQSLALSVCGLEDGTSKAVYKNVTFDVRSYKKIIMDVHCEASVEELLKDKDLNLFIRFGTDFYDNYYEYELPLYVTEPRVYINKDKDDQVLVWMEENKIELEFRELQTAKSQRNSNPDIPVNTVWTSPDNSRIKIKGNPTLNNMKIIMIGVRNPKDDGLTKCGEIWVNELRLSDFDEKGGWASIGRASLKLADLATVNLSGNITTFGFGSIEKKVSERSRENIKGYDLSSSVELGKLFPEDMKIRVPLYMNYSESFTNPQYDPLSPDILTKDVKDATPVGDWDEYKKAIRTYTMRKSMNLTNVKKNRQPGKGKAHIYDIENFSATYAFNENLMTNINTVEDRRKTYRGGLNYNYSTTPKNIKPFGKSKSKLMKNKYMKIIKDINFNYVPSRISVRANLDRLYGVTQYRNTTGSSAAEIVDTSNYLQKNFNKNFTFNRVYDVKYDLSKGIKFTYSGTNAARVMESPGEVTSEVRKEAWNSVANLGKNSKYHQTTKLDWKLPINKIPIFNWVTMSVRYTANYDWTRAPFDDFSFDKLGNTIENSNTKQITNQFNLTNLYNKVPYLKKINQKARKAESEKKKTARKKAAAEKAADEDDGEEKTVEEIKKEEEEKKKQKEKEKELSLNPIERALKIVMGIKSVSLNYSSGQGELLPGYTQTSTLIGTDLGSKAPGLKYIFALQDPEHFSNYAESQGWLISDTLFNQIHKITSTENISGRITVEPIKGFNLQISADRKFSRNVEEIFKPIIADSTFDHTSRIETGNFSMSYNFWRTAFSGGGKTASDPTFDRFKKLRQSYSTDYGQENSKNSELLDSNQFYSGYGQTSQEVLIPAFIEAYSGKKVRMLDLPFPNMPHPNWKITYKGLAKIKALKKHFKTINISHSYKSTMNYSYKTNLLYEDNDEDGFADLTDVNENYLSVYEIASITASEKFSPLISVDMVWRNSIKTKVGFNKGRNLTMSFSNNQMTEILDYDISVGSGYRLKDMAISIKSGGSKKSFKSDLDLRADVSFKFNKSIIRDLEANTNIVTRGQRQLTIKVTADYVLTKNLNIQLFFDRTMTNPFLAPPYRNAYSKGGVSLRFTL